MIFNRSIIKHQKSPSESKCVIFAHHAFIDIIDYMTDAILLIDGNNIAFRAASVIPLDILKTTDTRMADRMVNKRMRIMNELYDKVTPVYVFDEPRNDFTPFDAKVNRRKMDDEYKGSRPKIGVDEIATLKAMWIQSWCQQMYSNGNNVIAYPGAEADDIIAYASEMIGLNHASQDGLMTAIWSADKDLLQCVNDSQGIYAIRRKGKDEIRFTEQTVLETKLVPPSKIRLQLALQGDSADGYKGIRGYGPKSKKSIELINNSETIQDIITALPDSETQLMENWILAGMGSDYLPSGAIERTEHTISEVIGYD